MGTMAYDIRHVVKSGFSLFNPNGGIYVRIDYNVCFQYLGGYAGGWCKRKALQNFRFGKFKNALAELLLYVTIIHVIYLVMLQCGDNEAAKIVIKSLTYVFMYVYLQNAFRNLIKAYPTKVALRIIYHVIRLEFTRVLPGYWQPIIERYQREYDSDIINDKEKEVRE